MEKKNQKNIYVCQVCSKFIITENLNDGVTPFAIPCQTTENCHGLMYSGFYQIDQNFSATHVWYKPNEKELTGLSPELKNHVEKGGLILKIREDESNGKSKPSRKHPRRWYRRNRTNRFPRR